MANFQIRNWNGQQIIEAKRRAVERALYKGASHILNESNNIAPLDEGPLTQTSDVDVDPDTGTASVFYVQKYARRVHEDPNITIHRGREKKYLEKTVLREGDNVRDIMASEIRDIFGGGS